MYAYHLSPDPRESNFLLYEFVARGALDEILLSPKGQRLLSLDTRTKIALDIARGLNFLHTGVTKHLGHTKKSVEYTLCHRDLKSANVCITSNFTAKIIDCGLGKLVADESKTAASFARSAQISSGGGAQVGSPGYRDPVYEDDADYRYGPECDMFSFGVILAKLITGSLSMQGSAAALDGDNAAKICDKQSTYRKYVVPGRKK